MEHWIVQHQPLRLEQRAKIAAREPALNAVQLIGGAPPRLVHPGKLAVDPGCRNGKANDLCALDEDDGPAGADTGGHPDAL